MTKRARLAEVTWDSIEEHLARRIGILPPDPVIVQREETRRRRQLNTIPFGWPRLKSVVLSAQVGRDENWYTIRCGCGMVFETTDSFETRCPSCFGLERATAKGRPESPKVAEALDRLSRFAESHDDDTEFLTWQELWS